MRFATIWEGLFEKKHIEALGKAWALYGKLICYADYKTGITFIRYGRLADLMKQSPLTIQRQLQRLLDHGYITVTRHSHHLEVQIANWRDVREQIKSFKKEVDKAEVIHQLSASDISLLDADTSFLVADISSPRLEAPLSNNQIINNTLHVSTKRGGKCPLVGNPNWPNGHTECVQFIESTATHKGQPFINYGKQIGALHKTLRAGYSFDQLSDAIYALDADKFYGERGWDFATLAAYLEKGTNARK